MNALSESYRKVRYDLRPAKQVERLIMIDALRRLSCAGFPISDYHYTGMGSIHFYDFTLFHKYVGITRMTSVEASMRVKKRVSFNKPFGLIKVRMADVGEVIAELSKRAKHFVWLDYDSHVKESYAADAMQAAIRCKAGSIIVITVDVDIASHGPSSRSLRDEFKIEFGDRLPAKLKPSAFTPGQFPQTCATILSRAIQQGLQGRQGVSFQTLFYFVYQDGHRMLTIGGMIVDEAARRRLQRSSIMGVSYLRQSIEDAPFEIRVPVLTRKERLYIDANMPSSENWRPTEFELDAEDLRAYREIYRFAPNYAELIL